MFFDDDKSAATVDHIAISNEDVEIDSSVDEFKADCKVVIFCLFLFFFVFLKMIVLSL